MKNQNGFTLVELVVVCAIIGVLSQLGFTSFYVYRSRAAYAVIQQTMHDIRNAAEAGTVDPDNPPTAVPLTIQNSPGAIADPLARSYLVGMQLPKNVKLQVSYDPLCISNLCVAGFAELRHCAGKKYLQWMKFGDGDDLLVEDIAGAGC